MSVGLRGPDQDPCGEVLIKSPSNGSRDHQYLVRLFVLDLLIEPIVLIFVADVR